MDALLPPLVAAFLAEWGDKTQLLAAMLAIRFRRPRAILAGVVAAAFLNSLLAALGGSLISGLVTFRAATLMTALALLLAGIGALIPQKHPRLETQGAGGVAFASFFAFAVLEFGDKTQFLTAALAARADSFWMTGIAAAIGIVIVNVPAIFLAERFSSILPLHFIRRLTGAILLIAGAFTAIWALGLL